MEACGGSTEEAPYEARYIENSESPLFFFPDDASRISQYSCLAPFHDPGEQWLLTPFSVLAFLRAIDPAEADACRLIVVQNFDGVAIEDADDLPRQLSSTEQRGNDKQDNTDYPLHERCMEFPAPQSGEAYEVHRSDCVPGLHELYDRHLGGLKPVSPP